MADRDPPAAAVLLGQIADEGHVEFVRPVADIEMEVDIGVVLMRQLEDAADLALMVGIVARRAADRLGAAFQPFDQQFLDAGVIGQPVLRKDADLDVDRPSVIADQRLDAVKAAHADRRVDLDLGAHAGRAVDDAVFEGLRRPPSGVFDGQILFDLGNPLHRVDAAAGFGRQAVDQPRLVEVDVGLDQPGAGEPAAGVIALAGLAEPVPERRDPPALDADVDRLRPRPVGEPGVAHDQIHRGPSFVGSHVRGASIRSPGAGWEAPEVPDAVQRESRAG